MMNVPPAPRQHPLSKISSAHRISSIEESFNAAHFSSRPASSDSLFQQSSQNHSSHAHAHPSAIVSNTSNLYQRSSLDPAMNSPKDPLVMKLTAFEARGWISRSDYMQYRKMLSNVDQRRGVHNILAEIAARRKQTTAPAAVEPNPPLSILYKGSNLSGASRNLHVSWEDQSLTSDASNKENGVRQETLALKLPPKPTARPPPIKTSPSSINISKQQKSKALMLEPSDLWKGKAPLTERELQVLFVEMCFFARLGFVQPPCCLKCTYRQAVNNERVTPQQACANWVVWRKNAAESLHPNKLGGNIVIMQCHAANSLLEGGNVDGYCWDVSQKQLVQEHFDI